MGEGLPDASVDAEEEVDGAGEGNPFLLDGPYGLYDPRPGAYGTDDEGGGPYDPETGLRDWYGDPDADATAPPDPEPELVEVGWQRVLDNWTAVENDLHERFGIDVESGILHQRTWRWMRIRINDLIDQPSRLRKALGLTVETRS